MRALVAAFNEGRFEDFAARFARNGVLEFPQSGEKIGGRDRIAAMYAAAPFTPQLEVNSIREAGELVIADLVPGYGDGSSWTALLLFEFEGGLVSRQTAYFGAPFDPPQWRREFGTD